MALEIKLSASPNVKPVEIADQIEYYEAEAEFPDEGKAHQHDVLNEDPFAILREDDESDENEYSTKE